MTTEDLRSPTFGGTLQDFLGAWHDLPPAAAYSDMFGAGPPAFIKA